MMPPPAPMPSAGPPGNYGPHRSSGYNSGMGRDRNGQQRYNDRGFPDSGKLRGV